MTRSKLCLIVALVSFALGTVAAAEPIFRIVEGPDPFSRAVSDGPDPISGVIGDGPDSLDPFYAVRPTVINDNPDPFGAIDNDPDVVHPFWAGPTVVCFLVAEPPHGALCFVGIEFPPSSID